MGDAELTIRENMEKLIWKYPHALIMNVDVNRAIIYYLVEYCKAKATFGSDYFTLTMDEVFTSIPNFDSIIREYRYVRNNDEAVKNATPEELRSVLIRKEAEKRNFYAENRDNYFDFS